MSAKIYLGLLDACAGRRRACNRIWPESTAGKKSLPIKVASPSEPRLKIVNPARTGMR